MVVEQEHPESELEFQVKTALDLASDLVRHAGLKENIRGKKADTGLAFDDYQTPEIFIRNTLKSSPFYIKERLALEAAYVGVRNVGYQYLVEIFNHYGLDLKELIRVVHSGAGCEGEFEGHFEQLRKSAGSEAQEFLDRFDERAITKALALKGELNEENLETSVETTKQLGRFAKEIKDETADLTFEPLDELIVYTDGVGLGDGDLISDVARCINVCGRNFANEVVKNASTVADGIVSSPVEVEEIKTEAPKVKTRRRFPSNKFLIRSAGAIALAGAAIVGYKLRPDGFSIPNPLERQDQTNTITLNLHEVVVPTIKPIIIPYARERLIDRINKITDDNQQLREQIETDQKIIERLQDDNKDLNQDKKELEEDNRDLQSELDDLQKQPTPDSEKPTYQPPEAVPVLSAHDFSQALPAFIADNPKLQDRNIDLVYKSESFVVGPALRQWMVEQGIRPEIANKIDAIVIGEGEGLTQALERIIEETFAAQGEVGQGATNNPNTAQSSSQAPLSFELEQKPQHSDSWGISVAGSDFAPQAETVKAVDVSFTIERSERTISGETADNGAAFLDQNKVNVAVAQEVAVMPGLGSNKAALTGGQVNFRAKEIVDQISASYVSEIRDQAARETMDLDQKAEDERQIKVAGDRAKILGTIGQELADSNQEWYQLLDEPLWVPNVTKYDDEDEDDEEEDFVYFSVIDRFKKQLTRLDRPFSRLFASHRLITSKKLRLEKYLSNREGISG